MIVVVCFSLGRLLFRHDGLDYCGEREREKKGGFCQATEEKPLCVST